MTTFDAAATPSDSPYAGFWWRVLALCIDIIVLSLASALLGVVIGIGPNPLGFDRAGAGLPGIILQWLYFAGFESSAWRGTPGKRACGLAVVDLYGGRISFLRATARYFAKILSTLILFVGYIMVAFTARRQGLHDLIASTLVMKEIVPLRDEMPRPPPAAPDTH